MTVIYRITETGDRRITETGDDRVTEDSVVVVETVPTFTLRVALDDDPLEPDPDYTEIPVTSVRAITVSAGKTYEYDRTEAGTMTVILDNEDGDWNPDNTASPYYPNLIPTRRIELTATIDDVDYDIFEGFTEGFPQEYPGSVDSLVQLRAADWFYPLNMLKFTGGSTTLSATIDTTPEAGTVETITVGSIALPLPQAFPFVIQVGEAGAVEKMTVTGTPGANQWTVERGADGSTIAIHAVGATVRSEAVRFAAASTGQRIRDVLDFLGIDALDRDIDDGNTNVGDSDDLAGTAPLEHILFMSEVEHGGKLFAARSGALTFRERQWQFVTETEPRDTFGTQTGQINYGTQNVRIEDDESRIANRVKLTIADGSIVETFDQDSIDAHFERVFDRSWPIVSAVAAKSNADYMLGVLKESRRRIPAILVDPVTQDDVSGAWATVLGAELGYRYAFELTAPDGTSIETDVLVERRNHQITPADWRVGFEFSKAGPRVYWRLGTAGFSELGSTTRLGD